MFKRRLVGLFQHFSRRLIVLLLPNEFLHSSPEAPRTTQARETSASEGRNYYQGIQLTNPEFTKVLGSFTYRKAGTWDRFFHFPSEERNAVDYSDTRKIQRLWPGSNPRSRVPEDSMLTTRPPKPLIEWKYRMLSQVFGKNSSERNYLFPNFLYSVPLTVECLSNLYHCQEESKSRPHFYLYCPKLNDSQPFQFEGEFPSVKYRFPFVCLSTTPRNHPQTLLYSLIPSVHHLH